MGNTPFKLNYTIYYKHCVLNTDFYTVGGLWPNIWSPTQVKGYNTCVCWDIKVWKFMGRQDIYTYIYRESKRSKMGFVVLKYTHLRQQFWKCERLTELSSSPVWRNFIFILSHAQSWRKRQLISVTQQKFRLSTKSSFEVWVSRELLCSLRGSTALKWWRWPLGLNAGIQLSTGHYCTKNHKCHLNVLYPLCEKSTTRKLNSLKI